MNRSKVRLTKEFSFEMAHALEGYDGACREIHGHSYRLFVTVRGVPNTDSTHPKFGMTMDFGELKRIVKELIVDRYDHALTLPDTARTEAFVARMGEQFAKVVQTPYQPTCENMVSDFAQQIIARLPEGVDLVCIKLHETATSYAEWYAEDNL